MLTTYDFIEEPKGALYRALIDYCSDYAQIVLLVLREIDWLDASAQSFLGQFQSILITQEQTSEWPGTRLTCGTAMIFKFHVKPDLIEYLKTTVEGLYEWQQPKQLEDLCFLRQDGTTLLATISHECDAYLELTSEEYREIVRLIPSLHIVKHSDPLDPGSGKANNLK